MRQCTRKSPPVSLSAAPRYPPDIRGAGLLPSSPSVIVPVNDYKRFRERMGMERVDVMRQGKGR